jgi:acetamidase/formamidase
VAEHHLNADPIHAFFDRDHPARLTIDAGDTVVFTCKDASDGQITPESGPEAYVDLDGSRIHALTGPVAVRGAEPGDTLVVDVLDLRHHGWGWSGFRPGGIGLLADEFDAPFLQHWSLIGDRCTFSDSDDVAVPFEPFCGVMGVAPAEHGRLHTAPPRLNGGNLDIRGLTVGATAYFPVLAPGALFSTGDAHAAQGDGEVCGTGIESPMTVTLRFDLRKGASVRELQFRTPSPLTRADSDGYYVTTAHGPDLYLDSRNAVRAMVDWLEAERGLARPRGYVLCSVAADLKISEVVDEPNWIVSCYLPLSVLRG